jgi:hypothetical protein
MSVHRPTGGNASDTSPVALRPLPPRPSLEFERKRAKKLLREMRLADPSAKLSDAQFAAARDYGFPSWPRLVEYFTTLDRHEKSSPPPSWYPLEEFEQQADRLLTQQEKGRAEAAAQLAMFVPRFYGKHVADVIGAPTTIDDARLVIARTNRLPSWDVLAEWVSAAADEYTGGWNRCETPIMQALSAIRAHDLVALGRVIDKHPELITAGDRLTRGRGSAMNDAIIHEARTRTVEARNVVDFLVSRGADLRGTLNRMVHTIIGYGHAGPGVKHQELLEFLIARGADPAWVPENGFTVLEHMLARHRSHEEIEFVLRYVTPPKAFWIAAGLGDVQGLKRYFDATGKLVAAARKHRPDFTALGPFSLPCLPDAGDIDIMAEAFYVALINDRLESLDVLLERGFPVDYSFWGSTAFSYALNSRNVKLVEYLIRRGAHADIDGASAEEIDQWLYEHDPTDARARRIYELCGGRNADAVLQSYEAARLTTPPPFAPQLRRVLDFARDDAASLGQVEVRDENLFVGLFRDEKALPVGFLGASGVDVGRFRKSIEHRLARGESHSADHLPFGAEAQATLDLAIARRMQKHWRTLNTPDLMFAVVRYDTGPVADLLLGAGAQLAKLREELAKV